MARVSSPCFKCEKRHAECKVTCESFIEWDKADKAEKAKIDKLKQAEYDFMGVKVGAIEHSKSLARAMKGRNRT